MKTVVLAGGGPGELSVLVPPGRSKHTLRIVGRPLIHYPLMAVGEAVGRDVILVYSSEDVYREAVELSSVRIIGVRQEGEGIEEAVKSAAKELGGEDYFLLVYGDLVVDSKALFKVMESFYSYEPTMAVLTTPLEEKYVYTYGVASTDLNGLVRRVVEKPSSIDAVEKPAYTVGGVYVLPTWIIDCFEKGLGFTDALNKVASEGRAIAVHWNGLWIDVGYPADLLEATRQLLNALRGLHVSGGVEVERNVVIEPPAFIDEGTYVDHGAVVKGPVYIGRGCFIGAHSFLRHYASLEGRVRVGAFSEVKNANVQPNVVVDSYTYIGDSIIGGDSCIGSHVVTLNLLPDEETPPRLREHLVAPQSLKKPVRKLGAIIGYGARIGAGTTLYPQSVVQPMASIEPGSVYKVGRGV
ncbi:MAG: NDP-sugar synthase [Desulfurococcaceae archaeon]